MILHLKATDKVYPDTAIDAIAQYFELDTEHGIVLPKGRTLQIYASLKREWDFPTLNADIGLLCWNGYIQPSVHLIGWISKKEIQYPVRSNYYHSIESLKKRIDQYR